MQMCRFTDALYDQTLWSRLIIVAQLFAMVLCSSVAVPGENTFCVSTLGVAALFFYEATLHGVACHGAAIHFGALFPPVP